MPKLKFNVPVKLTSGQVEKNDGTGQALLNKTEVERLIDSHSGVQITAEDLAGLFRQVGDQYSPEE